MLAKMALNSCSKCSLWHTGKWRRPDLEQARSPAEVGTDRPVLTPWCWLSLFPVCLFESMGRLYIFEPQKHVISAVVGLAFLPVCSRTLKTEQKLWLEMTSWSFNRDSRQESHERGTAGSLAITVGHCKKTSVSSSTFHVNQVNKFSTWHLH